VYENRLVTGASTLRGVLAAFTERHVESWAPLTCVSHILVWQFLGHGPAVHHLTNVVLHAASAVLLFLVLWRMTGRLWPSALVAVVFAVHPLRAESVAWVTERKDVLSGFFFMLTLAPVIGLVQFGVQAEADRFSYLPRIGLTIALVWIAGEACRSGPRFRRTLAVATTCGLMILVISGWRQTCYWHDSEALWTHSLACTPRNTMAHNGVGLALADCGRMDEAIAHFQKAVEIEPGRVLGPGYVPAQNNLGLALAGCGRIDEAVAHFRKALDIKPDYADAHINLGMALAARGGIDEAIDHYRRALVFAEQQNKARLAAELKARLRAFEAGTPQRQPQSHPDMDPGGR
jgi:hypothetical protein